MAEITGLRNNALPYPVYGSPYGVVFPILDADGDLVTGAAGLDSEVSMNGDTFTNCTNEATEIDASSGIYYLLLTGAEMTADVVSVIVKTSTEGAKTTSLVLYPRKLVPIATGTSQGGAAGYITLAASSVLFTDQFNGCLCLATIDTNLEARIIDDCSAANQQCSVTPDWNVAPDADDTYIIYLPEGMQFPTANVRAISDDTAAADNLESACDNYSVTRGLAGTALPAAAADGAGGLPISDAGGLDLDTLNANVSAVLADTGTDGVLIAAGAITATAIATGAIDADAIADDAIDAGAIAADAITAAKIANGAIDAATFAAGAINAAAIADAAIDAATFAANAITSIVIADDAITAAKINTGAFTADAFAADAIVAATLATGALTADAFAADALVAATFATNSLTADALAADAITEIQAGLALEATSQDIVADTNEIQAELADGGRLDLLIDAIKAKTDILPTSPAKNEALAQFVFLMVDNTDHVTPATGLTVTGEISKDGGAFAGLANSIDEISDGYYKITGGITQAEMNADVVALKFSAVDADQRSIIIVTSS